MATEAKRIKFMLDGCDISFVAEAPEDITLKQLLKQCDRIVPDYCACGIRSLTKTEEKVEISIDYDDIKGIPDETGYGPACKILSNGEKNVIYEGIYEE